MKQKNINYQYRTNSTSKKLFRNRNKDQDEKKRIRKKQKDEKRRRDESEEEDEKFLDDLKKNYVYKYEIVDSERIKKAILENENGVAFFQNYANNLKSVYDSGVTDINKLIWCVFSK